MTDFYKSIIMEIIDFNLRHIVTYYLMKRWSVMGKKIITFMKKEIVFVVAAICAIISCFFIPIDREYIGYFDFKTLVSLFTMMAVICAIESTHVLEVASRMMVIKLKNTRMLAMGLVFLTFVSSMFIANDMALLSFLPLSAVVLISTKQEKKAMYIFILQNIGANMGGMLTPFGNPQNIYLYNYYNIPNGKFLMIMLPAFLCSILLLIMACMFVKKEPLVIHTEQEATLDAKRLVIYSIAFIIAVLMVLKLVNYYVGTIVACLILIIFDRKSFLGVDYMLLLTFCAFFIFTGNLSRVPAVSGFLEKIIQGKELIVALLSTQVICNVPTAILLSKFTSQYAPILIAVNIGALGTIIASLASLIAFKIYTKNFHESKAKYLGRLFLVNICFLVVLVFVSWICVL